MRRTLTALFLFLTACAMAHASLYSVDFLNYLTNNNAGQPLLFDDVSTVTINRVTFGYNSSPFFGTVNPDIHASDITPQTPGGGIAGFTNPFGSLRMDFTGGYIDVSSLD